MSKTGQPNFILIMTDQQRADLRKGGGFPLDTMPRLDSLGKEGIDFNRAYTPNPICVAARVSMLTGRYPSATRVKCNHCDGDEFYNLDMFDILHEAGYATALCGKNHTYRKAEDFTFSRITQHLSGDINKDDITEQEKEFYKYLKSLKFIYDKNPSPFPVECQLPYRNVTDAMKFIDGLPSRRPFFLWLSFSEPHNPYQVPEPYYSMFKIEDLPKVNADSTALKEKGYKYKHTRAIWEKLGEPNVDEFIERSRANYFGMLRLIDDQISRLCEYLKEKDIYDNTHIIFVNDHGDFVGEYGMMRKGPELPDSLCRVSFVWRGPNVVSSKERNSACVNLVDIFPTICDILKKDIPEGVQGKSLWPILTNNLDKVPQKEFEVAYSETGFGGLYWEENDTGLTTSMEGAYNEKSDTVVGFDCLNTWTQCGAARMVRKGDYKLICDMLGNVQLYNLVLDPSEINNIRDREENSEILGEMLNELVGAMLRAQDNLPSPKTRYRIKRHERGYYFDEGFIAKDPGVSKLPVQNNRLSNPIL